MGRAKYLLMADGYAAEIVFSFLFSKDEPPLHAFTCDCWICNYKRQQRAQFAQVGSPVIRFELTDEQYWGDSD